LTGIAFLAAKNAASILAHLLFQHSL